MSLYLVKERKYIEGIITGEHQDNKLWDEVWSKRMFNKKNCATLADPLNFCYTAVMFYYNLTGEVNGSSVQGVIQFFNAKRIEENFKSDFSIFLSSPGGDIDSGIRLYDFLKSIPNKVHIYGFGQVDSAAIMIFLAGDTRLALTNTRFRIHPAQYNLTETHAPLSYFKEIVNFFSELDQRMREIVAKETKKSQKEIDALYQAGKILSDTEAKKIGIVHEIVSEMPTPQHYIDQFRGSNPSPR